MKAMVDDDLERIESVQVLSRPCIERVAISETDAGLGRNGQRLSSAAHRELKR